MKTKLTTLLSVLALSASAVIATAQDNQGDNDRREGRGNRGDRGNFNPEEFRQRMNERLKGSLKVNDEEWNAIQPLIAKVQDKQRDAMSGRFGGFGGRGGRGDGGGGDQPARPGAAESKALRDALENESTSADDLKAKLTAVREQRKKAEAELAAAREELRKVLTVRQEAALVAAGMLE